MASVPSHVIKTKHVDYDGEIFACMGLPIEVARIRINPPSFGVFSLLEVMDSKFIKDFKNSDAMDFCKALYVAFKRRDAAGEICKWIEDGGREKVVNSKPETWTDFERNVAEFANNNKLHEIGFDEIIKFYRFLVGNTFTGYDMIPSSGPIEYMPYLFGAETMANVVMTAGYDAVWNMPLCMVGHIAATKAKANGIKGVARPKDPEDIKKQLEEAEARESRGELHPWQIKEPDMYGLTDEQMKARPEVKQEYNQLLKAVLRAKREAQEKKSNA